MPDFMRLVATLREQMQADLSRSDVLRVLIWPILILTVALIAAAQADAPNWALIGIGTMAAAFLVLYAVAFIFLLIYDRDALRSEKYSLHKMAIEHGLIGDDKVGLIDTRDVRPTKQQARPALGKPEEGQ